MSVFAIFASLFHVYLLCKFLIVEEQVSRHFQQASLSNVKLSEGSLQAQNTFSALAPTQIGGRYKHFC